MHLRLGEAFFDSLPHGEKHLAVGTGMFRLLLDSVSQIWFTLRIVLLKGLAGLWNAMNETGVGRMSDLLKSEISIRPDQDGRLRLQEARQAVDVALIDHKNFFGEPAVGRDNLSFTHSIFVQCFLPLRPLTAPNNQRWEVNHGSACLSIEAGRLADPGSPGQWEAGEVPAGPKARLLFAYINDFAIRHRTPVIDLGKSLRGFMERNGVPIGGPNGREVSRQLKNIASARIVLGIWSEARVSTRQSRVAARIDFWRHRNPGQGTFWEPELQLAPEYFDELRVHRVPVYFPALVKLQANPRAMDVFCWLVYRMRSVTFPVKIPYAALHPVFGGGIKLLKHFKIEFRKALMVVSHSYPQARIELKEDHLILHRSPCLIPRGV